MKGNGDAMNIHYEDGFQDALTYRGFLPPPPRRDHTGNLDFAHYQEYEEGFNAGVKLNQRRKGTVTP